MKDDQYFLKQAINKGNELPEPYNFGAVIVKDAKIIASDFNHVAEFNDPTAHAETSALKQACQKLETFNLQGCTMYASHEPCLMCFSCAAWAQVERIVYAQPASQTNFTYEFTDLSLQDLVSKLTRPMKVELIRIN